MNRDIAIRHALACLDAIAVLVGTVGGGVEREVDALELSVTALSQRAHDYFVFATRDDAIRFADPLLRHVAERSWRRAKGESA